MKFPILKNISIRIFIVVFLLVPTMSLPTYFFLVQPNFCEYEVIHPGFEVSTSYDESNETLVFSHVAGGELNESNTNALVLEVLEWENRDLVVVHREQLSTADTLPFRPGERLVVPANERWAAQNYVVRLVHVRDPILPWYCTNREPRRMGIGRETI